MKLVSFQASNFRQFYGETPEIKFADDFADDHKNVTLIHGDNGHGKTAILNAFTWVLYGKFTPAFRLPDELVSKKALSESSQGDIVKTWVKLCFKHDRSNYELTRNIEVKKGGNRHDFTNPQETVKLRTGSPEGIWRDEKAYEAAINRVLPEDLYTYFFFDGERIERMVNPTADDRAQLAKATKLFMGTEVLDRGEKHLQSARAQFNVEFKGDSQLQGLLTKQKNSETELQKATARGPEIEGEIDAAQNFMNEVEANLRNNAKTRDLQKRRDQVSTDYKDFQSRYSTSRARIAELISTNGATVILGSRFGQCESLIDGLRKKGELPSGIKKQFVTDLLADDTCICGACLKTDHDARKRVEGWLAMGGIAEVEEAALRMNAHIENYRAAASSVWESIAVEKNTCDELYEQMSRKERDLDDISDKLNNDTLEDINQLEKRRLELKSNIENLLQEKGGNSNEISKRQEDLDAIVDSIGTLETGSKKVQLAQRRYRRITEAIEVIQNVRLNMTKNFQSNLQINLRSRYRKMTNTPYVPMLEEDFSLTLLNGPDAGATPVGSSTGENQILGLSFVSCIIEQHREHYKKSSQIAGPASSTFPIVMDSAFGNLDPGRQAEVCQELPNVANQLIVMVSKSQYTEDVKRGLGERIGREYYIPYSTPRDDKESEVISLNGRDYPYVNILSNNEEEFSEIVEVIHG